MRAIRIFRTAGLLGLLTGIFLGIGYLLGGFVGMSFALILAFLMNFFAYWYSDKIVLAMYGARPLKDERIESIVENLAKNANIPKPKLFIAELPVPNAFATGRSPKHAAVCVTRGLIKTLNEDEVEAVLAHEIAHIKNRDTLLSTLAATIAGAISYLAQLAWFGLFGEEERGAAIVLLPLIILAPIAAMLVQLAISRGREFLADEVGAIICGKPLSLANALRKISGMAEAYPIEGNAATSHLWIVNPFSGNTFAKLFSTHPPVSERIRRLEDIAKKAGENTF
jgi:heat shock protein HtpX